jgi:hypothetical protein
VRDTVSESFTQLARKFRKIEKLVQHSQDDPLTCWIEALRIARDTSPVLKAAPIRHDIFSVTIQLRRIFDKYPVPKEISFWWFGLFDVQEPDGSPGAGFYLGSGRGDDGAGQLAAGTTSVYPAGDDLLDSEVLALVQAHKVVRPEEYEKFDYLLTFAAAAVIAKFASVACHLTPPVFVGFNSGDFARVL